MEALLVEIGVAVLVTVVAGWVSRRIVNRRLANMDEASKRALASSVTLLVAVIAAIAIASGRSETIRNDVVDGIIGFLPSLIVGVVILVLGFVSSRLAGIVVEQAMRSRSAVLATRLKSVVSGALLTITALIALKQMGIETDVLVLILAAMLATGTIAGGLAVGLGSLPLARQVAAGRHVEDRLRVGLNVSVDGLSGTIRSINLASVSVRSEDGTVWEIPNLLFLEHAVEVAEGQ